jgi:casein kinase II subunit beta
MSSSDDSIETWIDWFLSQEGNEFLCEVDRRYIEDNFNLYGLREVISNFRLCLDIILDRADQDLESESNLEASVADLYGLIHARYILTKRGQEAMLRKYRKEEFGTCPALACQRQPCLPIGSKDSLRQCGVRIYCPRCNQVMLPARRTLNHFDDYEVDGAYVGTTFPHLLLMQYPTLIPPPPVKTEPIVPRVFGFRIRSSHHLYRRAGAAAAACGAGKRSKSGGTPMDVEGNGRKGKGKGRGAAADGRR